MEIEDYVDDLYFSVLSDEEELLPISDDKYAEELQLQECIMSSVISSLQSTEAAAVLVVGTSSKDLTIPTKIHRRVAVVERGESSGSFCEICMEGKTWAEMFRSNNCSHVFCSDCISRYIAAKIQENTTRITCPDVNCKGVLEPQFCQSVIPARVFERWGNALCESVLSRTFYCPYRDCQEPLEDDGEEIVRESECPSCCRLFCVQCKVPWHSGVRCSEYQRMNARKRGREDLMLVELSKKMKWKRCPSCKFFVEKTDGCPHMTCRCKFQFCYKCGKKWNAKHEGCLYAGAE